MTPARLAALEAEARSLPAGVAVRIDGPELLRIIEERAALLKVAKDLLPIAVHRIDYLQSEWPDVERDSANLIVRLDAMDTLAKAALP